MHILLLNYEFPPAGGGAGFATYNIGRELVRMGVRVDVLTARIEQEVDGEKLDGMTVYRVPSWRKGIHDCGLVGAYSYVAFAYFKRRKLLSANNYDIEHFFFSLPTGMLTLSPVTSNTPPYIVSLRGSDVPGYDLFNKTLEKLHYLLLPITRRIWYKAASVIALSNGLKLIANKTASDKKIKVIPNGIETDKFYPDPGKKSSATDKPLRLLAVSRLLERKGIHHLLEAIARPHALPVTLDIVGTGSYQEELQKKCTALGLNAQVKFLGFVRREALPALYRKYDLFTLPSQTESFGLVFAEAMSSGLPVISTYVGGIPELVRDKTDGILVNPAKPAEIRDALEHLIENPDIRKEMGAAARQRIVEKYSWKAIAKQYHDCYETVLSRTER